MLVLHVIMLCIYDSSTYDSATCDNFTYDTVLHVIVLRFIILQTKYAIIKENHSIKLVILFLCFWYDINKCV